MTLAEILEVENDAEILSFRCPDTGWLAWPTVRHAFLVYLINELAYPWPWAVQPVPTLWQHRGALAALARGIPHNARARRRGITGRPILIFATTGTIILWGGRAFNRVSDHFALAYADRTCAYEDVAPLQYEIPPNRANESVIYTLPAVARRYLASAFRAGDRFDEAARRLTAFLVGRVERLFGLKVSTERAAMTRMFIAKGLSRHRFERHRYERLFSQAPRLLLVTSGSHGSLAAAIQIAHAMGIPVAEYQHGLSGAGQPEYNFARTVADDPEYRATLPDYFLSFGRWWTERTNAPMRTVVIGSPHRSECLARLNDTGTEKDRTGILVVAKHREPERYIALASQLDRGIGDRCAITVRPYPLDRSAVLAAYPRGRIGSVIIDPTADFYASLARAEIVVSGPSTTLAEAFGVARRIFIWEQAGATFKYPAGTYEMFATVDDLIEKLKAPAPATPSRPPAEEVWASDWRERYRRFVEPFLV